MEDASEPRWLSFFGPTALIAADGREWPLVFRYRKSLLLLAWLAAQAHRPQRRAAVADLFWPLAEARARANLRVVLNDLAARLSAAALPDCLEADRDWLCLRPPTRLILDDQVVAAPGVFAPALRRRGRAPWCALEEEDDGGDLGGWLAARRLWFAEAAARALDLSDADTPAVPSAPTFPAPPVFAASGEWKRLALLQVLPEIAQADEKRAQAERQRLFAQLAETAAQFGGRPLYLPQQCLFVFGEDARGGGLRWQAWRAATVCGKLAPAARLGLVAGTVWRGADGQLSGRLVDLAGRLALCAEPGEIVADAGFAPLLPCAAEREELRFRGFPEPLACVRHGARTTNLSPGIPCIFAEAPFVGRTTELARLNEALARPGAVAAIVGPPGAGKSRLAAVCVARAGYDFAAWVGCRAELAHHPWKALFEWLSRPNIAVRAERLPQAEALRDFLARRHLAFEQRGRLIALLTDLVRDTLVVIDDAQWLDEATARLLAELRARTSARWLLTRRPQEGGWLPADAARIDLGGLDDASALALLRSLASEPLDAAEERARLGRSRGLPLWLIAESGARDPTFADALAGLSNLPAAQARVLGLAALLGMGFERGDLAALLPRDEVDESLGVAFEQSLIVCYSEDRFAFAHPLLRDAFLDRLDAGVEAALASAAADLYATRNQPTRAAKLYERAALPDKARMFYLAAADAALADYDFLAATTHFAQIERLGYPEGAVGEWARIRHARALVVRDGYGIDAIERLVGALARRPPPPADAPPEEHERHFAANALLYLWSGGASPSTGLIQAERLAALADTPAKRYAARWARANTSLLVGRLSAAHEDFAALAGCDLPLAERMRYFPSDPHAFILTNRVWAAWFLGRSDWRAGIDAMIERMAASPFAQDECIARTYAGAIWLCAGEWDMLAREAPRAHAIAVREAFGFWELFSGLLLQILAARDGIPPDPARCAQFEAIIRTAYPAGVNTVRWLILEAFAACGDWPEVARRAQAVLEDAERSEHLYCLPDIHRLLGQARLALGEAPAGRESFARAFALARANGAAGWIEHWTSRLGMDETPRPADRLLGTSGGFSQCPAD